MKQNKVVKFVHAVLCKFCGKLFFTVAVVSMLTTFIQFPVAASGVGLTGNFYSINFSLLPGQTSTGTEAYIILINTDTAPLKVQLTTEAPSGVAIDVSETDINLPEKAQKRLDIIVTASQEVKPGEYTLRITATSYTDASGIKVAGGSSQTAKLTVLNPSPNLIPIIGGAAAGVVVLAGAALYAARKLRRQPRNM